MDSCQGTAGNWRRKERKGWTRQNCLYTKSRRARSEGCYWVSRWMERDGWMDGRTEESLLKSASSIMRYKSMNRRARPERTKKLDLILSFFLEGKLKKKKSCKDWINSVPSHQQFTAFKCFKNTFARKNCFYLPEFTARDCACIKAKLTSHTHEFSGCCLGMLETQALASLFNGPLLRHTKHCDAAPKAGHQNLQQWQPASRLCRSARKANGKEMPQVKRQHTRMWQSTEFWQSHSL